MEFKNPEIEIQAVNLAQQWYSLSSADLPGLVSLLPQYLKCFSTEEEKKAFLQESLRIAKELVASPKDQGKSGESFENFKNVIQQHLANN